MLGVVFGVVLGLILGAALATWLRPRQQRELSRPQTTDELLREVDYHVCALNNRGLGFQVEEYNDGRVTVFTTLPSIEGIGRIFEQHAE